MYLNITFLLILASLQAQVHSFRALPAVRPQRLDRKAWVYRLAPLRVNRHKAVVEERPHNDKEDYSRELALLAPACVALFTASPAEAADTIPTALWAYAHYASMLAAMGSVAGQRFVLKPGMTEQEESVLGQLNIAYGIFLTLVIVSGYFRVTEVRSHSNRTVPRNVLVLMSPVAA